MLTALGPLRLRSSGAHFDPELREEDWREAWLKGLARYVAERIDEEAEMARRRRRTRKRSSKGL